MDWDEMIETLYDGSIEEIEAIRCPDCGGEIEYSFDPDSGANTIKCLGSCGNISRGSGGEYEPNCIKYFGAAHVIKATA